MSLNEEINKYIDHIKVYFNGFKYKQELDRVNARLEELTKKQDEEGLTELWEIRDEKDTLVTTIRALKRKIKTEKVTLSVLEKEVGVYGDYLEVERAVNLKQNVLDALKTKVDTTRDIIELQKTVRRMEHKVDSLKEKTIYWEGVLEDEDNGIYHRPEDLYASEYYKEELKSNRANQRAMKKDKTATNATSWRVNGSEAEGKKLMNANIKQILRSFDGECDNSLKLLNLTNKHVRVNALNKSFDTLNKLNVSNGVSITEEYYDLKLEEINLAHKEIVKKEDEKAIMRAEMEMEREEKKAQQEIENKKKVVDKDIKHYDKMMKELQQQIAELSDENQRLELEKEVEELEEKKADKEAEKEDLDFREENAKAGYVYIISNIGSFGENVVKIGVTRRLDPYDRIKELSTASVPFKFDVHAMVFSQDAYKLETELHNKFSSKRVNLVNNKKEFFQVTMDELKEVLDEYRNLTLNFEEVPEALEYRDTLKMRDESIRIGKAV